VPLQELVAWKESCGYWDADLLSVKGVVAPAIMVVLSKPRTHFEPTFWRHGQVPRVEETMKVGT
jgi:hypothetical protein